MTRLAPYARILRLFAVSFTLTLAGVGCEADSATAPAQQDVGSLDVVPDTTAADVQTSCPGGIGCACETSADCPSVGRCAPTPLGNRCAGPCGAGDTCPESLVCRKLPTDFGQQSVCVVPLSQACVPCTKDEQCATGGIEALPRCAGIADGKGADGFFCSAGCTEDQDCPSGYTCGFASLLDGATGRVCRPAGGSCSCSAVAISAESATTCRVFDCVGSRQCGASGLSACAITKGAETCNGLDDNCDGQTDEDPAVLCGDNEPCTGDSCLGKDGCDYQAISGNCDDGNACTEADLCQVSACLGVAVSCDDKNDCTTDSCDKLAGCQHVAFVGGCDDGDACTNGDSCSGTSCQSGSAVPCDDGEVCTADSCDPASGCVFAPAAGACDDGNVCTQNDTCSGGLCTAEAIDCDDGNGCSVDGCDPVTGCSYTADPVAICGPLSVPVALALDCDSDSYKPWLTTPTGPASFAWDFGSGALAPGAPVSCGLIASPTPAGCSPGPWTATATLGPLAVPKLQPGAKLIVALQSAGSWTAATAKIQGSTDGKTWYSLGTLPPSGSVWGGGTFAMTNVSGYTVAPAVWIRLLLEGGACPGISDTGWFVRQVSVYEDVCGVNNGGCDSKAQCNMLASGAVSCVCKAGYDGSGKTCTDIDECLTGSANCSGLASCTNTVGSYTCSCPVGYNLVNGKCIDIDECTTGAGSCGSKEVCINEVPGWKCACAPGYKGEAGACGDINECTDGTAGCDANAQCKNSIGSVSCVCKTGYTGDGKSCVDLDECATDKDQCSGYADCYNLTGSYSCLCKSGFSGDGFTCVPK